MSMRLSIEVQTRSGRRRQCKSHFSHIDASQACRAGQPTFGPSPRSTLVVAGSRLSGRYSRLEKISIDMAPSLSRKVALFCLRIQLKLDDFVSKITTIYQIHMPEEYLTQTTLSDGMIREHAWYCCTVKRMASGSRSLY